MKIVVASLQHETNTFSPVITAYDDFHVVKGAEMLEQIAVRTLFEEAGAELIPALYANALPSGIIEEKSYRRFFNEIMAVIGAQEQIDGVWLYLHGAMEVENIGSGEAYLVSAIRQKIGPDVPISVALDFHANNAERLVEHANIIYGYRTAPHTDMRETQMAAARLLLQCIREKLLPQPVMLRVPMISNGDIFTTTVDPGKTIMNRLPAMDQKEGMLCISLFNGNPFVDCPHAGASVIAIAKDDPMLARREAAELGQLLWSNRDRFAFEGETLYPEEAVRAALADTGKLVFLSDSGDNTTAGAPGDNAHLLKLLLAHGAQHTLVAGITDSRVIRRSLGATIGENIRFEVGAELDQNFSESVSVNGILLHVGRLKGWDREDAGLAAVFAIEGIHLVVTERRCAFVNSEIFRSIGLEITDYRIIAVKLGYLFPDLRKYADRSILALTFGASCEDIAQYEFTRIQRPMHPFDPNFHWEPDLPGRAGE